MRFFPDQLKKKSELNMERVVSPTQRSYALKGVFLSFVTIISEKNIYTVPLHCENLNSS